MDTESIKKEFGYEGKSKQWQVGFDALLKHMSDYLGETIMIKPKTITIYNHDQLNDAAREHGFPLDVTVMIIESTG